MRPFRFWTARAWHGKGFQVFVILQVGCVLLSLSNSSKSSRVANKHVNLFDSSQSQVIYNCCIMFTLFIYAAAFDHWGMHSLNKWTKPKLYKATIVTRQNYLSLPPAETASRHATGCADQFALRGFSRFAVSRMQKRAVLSTGTWHELVSAASKSVWQRRFFRPSSSWREPPGTHHRWNTPFFLSLQQ